MFETIKKTDAHYCILLKGSIGYSKNIPAQEVNMMFIYVGNRLYLPETKHYNQQQHNSV